MIGITSYVSVWYYIPLDSSTWCWIYMSIGVLHAKVSQFLHKQISYLQESKEWSELPYVRPLISFSSPPTWNIAPACKLALGHYFLLHTRTSWILNCGHVFCLVKVAFAVCCRTLCNMLNFTVYKSSCKMSVPWHIYTCGESSTSHHQEAIMVISTRPHPVWGKPLMTKAA